MCITSEDFGGFFDVWDSGQWTKWRLVIKCDPDKLLPAEAYAVINSPAVDAVMVGGTQGITHANTLELIGKIRDSGFKGPVVQEISAEDAVVPEVDAHFIPVVLNAGSRRWLVGAHLSAIKRYAGLIRWDKVVTEGYLVCNGDSAVGRLTRAVRVTAEDAAAYTLLAEEVYRFPLLYIEYSGRFGDLSLIRAVAGAKRNIHLFYGGGIRKPEQLLSLAPLVDTLVVGNIIYEDPAGAVKIVESIRLD